MEKWKIALSLALIAGFGVFQWFGTGKDSGENSDKPVTENRTQTAEKTPTPLPQLVALKGKTPIEWSIPKDLWLNSDKPIVLSDLKGSVAVIEFWRTECSHCQEAVPFMNQIYWRYKSRGLKVVTFQSPGELKGTNPEMHWQSVKEFAQKNSITYPVAFDTERKLKNKYKVDWYPLILVTDRSGHIQLAQSGHTPEKTRELAQTIERLLKEK